MAKNILTDVETNFDSLASGSEGPQNLNENNQVDDARKKRKRFRKRSKAEKRVLTHLKI